MAKKPKESASVENNHTLDNLLLALQISLSRVNKASSGVGEDKARSLITGNLAFSLSCKCEMADSDKLALNENGDIDLNLFGHINTGIGVMRLEESPDASSK